MRGRLVDAWKYAWAEIWEPLEQLDDFPLDAYTEIFVELEKALKHRLKTSDNPEDNRTFAETANDIEKARNFLHDIEGEEFAGDPSIAGFFKDIYDVLSEYDDHFCIEFTNQLKQFLESRNLRYVLQREPFKLQPHLPGVFAAVLSKINDLSEQDENLSELMKEFEHSFQAVSRSHHEADMKTCISKACMVVERIGSLNPDKGKANTFGAMCDKIPCWPHSKVQETVKNIYTFCCDYPGIRHAGTPESKIRALEVRDSIIVPLMLLTASSYFLTFKDITEITGIQIDKS